MARIYPRLQTCLTGDRIEEFEAVRAILLSLGVKDSDLSVQRVMSAGIPDVDRLSCQWGRVEHEVDRRPIQGVTLN